MIFTFWRFLTIFSPTPFLNMITFRTPKVVFLLQLNRYDQFDALDEQSKFIYISKHSQQQLAVYLSNAWRKRTNSLYVK